MGVLPYGMAKEDGIGVEGKIIERMRNSRFRVQMSQGHVILAYVAGKIRHQSGRMLEGDTVGVMLSPYDLSQGRIVYLSKR